MLLPVDLPDLLRLVLIETYWNVNDDEEAVLIYWGFES